MDIRKVIYQEGQPRQYYFNAIRAGFTQRPDSGYFSFGLIFQPIAWRVFTANWPDGGRKDQIELFFIDKENHLSTILFEGHALDRIFQLMETLVFRDERTLADVELVITPGQLGQAQFNYSTPHPTRKEEYKAATLNLRIYHQATLNNTDFIKAADNYFNPYYDPNFGQ